MSELLWALSAREIVDGYRAQQFTPTEVARAVFDRIEEHEASVGAFFTVTRELALEQARDADRRWRRSEPLSCLDGVPITVKDLDETAGVRTTFGYRGLSDNIPTRDSVVAGRVRESGAVMLGKTTTPAYGHLDSSENLVGPITANPHDLSRTPGGSSAGSAAAAAVGFGPIHIGSDAAGSVRIPGALSGVVGFKASIGAIPVWPQRFYHGSTIHSGILAREVGDVAMAMDVLARPHHRDPMSNIPVPAGGYALGAPTAPGRDVTFAVSHDLGYGRISPGVRAALDAALDVLRNEGWTLVSGGPGWSNPARMHEARWATAMAASFSGLLEKDPESIDSTLAAMIRAGERFSGVDMARYLADRGAMTDALNDLFDSGIDFLITATMPVTAWPLHSEPAEITDVELSDDAFARSYLCYPFNQTGNPAITVPCGTGERGLPVGLQIVGRLHADAAVLRVADAAHDAIARAGLVSRQPIDPRRA
ncbi:amidase [Microbacterium caowuchunii]|uniref:amidase n=1 Tax=Microbacterium caowuchunii TaxID=2614638 RepID=UPI0012463B01|nr:amidase family protein [Microbacterium caowuchunii]QEV99082.1 amidase [Microbacterium caowuchunii]